MALVIIAHSMLAMVAALQNPEFLEEVVILWSFVTFYQEVSTVFSHK